MAAEIKKKQLPCRDFRDLVLFLLPTLLTSQESKHHTLLPCFAQPYLALKEVWIYKIKVDRMFKILTILPIDFSLYLCFSFWIIVVMCRTGFCFSPKAIWVKRQPSVREEKRNEAVIYVSRLFHFSIAPDLFISLHFEAWGSKVGLVCRILKMETSVDYFKSTKLCCHVLNLASSSSLLCIPGTCYL